MNKLVAALVMALAIPAAPLLAAPASAEEAMKDLGIPVGQNVPLITGVSPDNEPKTFTQLTGEKGVTLAFFRSADWCPFCKNQLKDLNNIAAELEAKGYPLVALSYDSVETLKKFHDKEELTYTLLSDPDSEIIDAFGVRNMEVAGNRRFDGIPHPAIFFINTDGVVEAKLYEESYRDRPAPELILSTVDGLN